VLVAVLVGVLVAVAVLVGVLVAVAVLVGVAVFVGAVVGVKVGVAVLVGATVGVEVGVAVFVGAVVGVEVGVAVLVGAVVGVKVGVAVFVGAVVGVFVGVAVLVGVGVFVEDGPYWTQKSEKLPVLPGTHVPGVYVCGGLNGPEVFPRRIPVTTCPVGGVTLSRVNDSELFTPIVPVPLNTLLLGNPVSAGGVQVVLGYTVYVKLTPVPWTVKLPSVKLVVATSLV
jgi:hypothetical protein